MMSRSILTILTFLAASSLLATAPAIAQDDEGGMTFGDDFSLDTLLVTTFEAPKNLRREADDYEQFLADTMATEFMVFRMADVPAFADYDASTYVDACPKGQYIACVHAVGVRVQSEWALGGQLVDGPDGTTELTISIVDIDANRLVLTFPVDMSDNRSEVAEGIRQVFNRVLNGAYEGTDIRFDDPEPEPEEQLPVEDVGEDEGMTRGRENRGKRKRFTKDDIDRYEDSDAITPWEQKGLNKTSWKRWRNTRLSLMEWKQKARARQGEILVGITALTVGQGPWTQVYDGWYGLDSQTLETTEKSTVLDQHRGIERAWDFSLGVGIMPWLDVAVFGGPKVAPYSVRVQRIVEGQEPFIEEPTRRVVSSWMVGGRVGFEPLPTFPVRPTFHLGAYYWSGVSHTNVVDAPSELAILPKPWMVLVQASPGFEVDIGKHFYLWGRVNVDVPVAGRVAQESSSAGPLIAERPRPDPTDDGIGIAGSVGVTVRLRIPGKKPRRGGL